MRLLIDGDAASQIETAVYLQERITSWYIYIAIITMNMNRNMPKSIS